VEPFCGGLAVALGLGPETALLNDANPHLINFYRWLKRGLVLDLPMENRRAVFDRHRRRFNSLVAAGRTRTREAAALFYYLNRTGYNGLCRFNRRGEFNVPFGRYARIAYETDFSAYRPALAGWTFTSVDIARVAITGEDFVYADPPYDVEFRQYGPRGFTWDDQVRTAELLAVHPGPVVLVNQATPRIGRLYRGLGYRLRRVDAPRRISSSGDRRPAREIIATRNL
jgi:DNA adenine methylase